MDASQGESDALVRQESAAPTSGRLVVAANHLGGAVRVPPRPAPDPERQPLLEQLDAVLAVEHALGGGLGGGLTSPAVAADGAETPAARPSYHGSSSRRRSTDTQRRYNRRWYEGRGTGAAAAATGPTVEHYLALLSATFGDAVRAAIVDAAVDGRVDLPRLGAGECFEALADVPAEVPGATWMSNVVGSSRLAGQARKRPQCCC